MDSCGCDGFASMFDPRTAERDRERYRRTGPDRTTRMLLDQLKGLVGPGATLVDVGGGVGIIDQELLRAGAGHAVLVEASPAYLEVARQEARRLNLLERIEFVEGDFVRRAGEIDPADVVTLDRVVCCYRDAQALVSLAAARSGRVLGLVLPRDRWWIRLGLRLMNVTYLLRRKAYRAYAHRNARIDRLVAAEGLRPRAAETTLVWRVVTYERAA